MTNLQEFQITDFVAKRALEDEQQVMTFVQHKLIYSVIIAFILPLILYHRFIETQIDLNIEKIKADVERDGINSN